MVSEYAHSSAESNYLSQAYYKEAKLLFTPAVEQKTTKTGPKDEKNVQDLAILKATDAEQKFFAIAGECCPK